MTTLTAIPAVTRLSGRVIRILGCNPGPMTLQGTNTYLVGTGSKRVLIDTGEKVTAAAYTKVLAEVLSEEKATIEHLILTHWHHDHIGGVPAVQNLIKSASASASEATVWKYPRPPDDPNKEKERPLLENVNLLKDEQVVEVEGASLRVQYTPGHTSDHVALLLEQEQALFSGDCVLGETTAVFEDLYDYLVSLRKILDIRAKLIYPGHGPVVDEPEAKVKAYIEHRNKREQDIIAFLETRKEQGACAVMEIVESLYRNTPKDRWPAAAYNVTNHLTKLLKENRLSRKNDKWLLI